MDKPTQEQIRELWEWCGFRFVSGVWEQIKILNWSLDRAWELPDTVIVDPEGGLVKTVPPIDLNNLFKYAVPKLQDKGNPVTLVAYECKRILARVYKDCFTQRPDGGVEPFLEPIREAKDDDPALALFWAIREVIKED